MSRLTSASVFLFRDRNGNERVASHFPGFGEGIFDWVSWNVPWILLGSHGRRSIDTWEPFRRMVMLSSILSSALIFVGVTVESQFWIYVSWSPCGFTIGPLLPTVFAWTNRLFTSRSGFATGLIYSLGFVGGVFSPWLLGTLADFLSLNLAMIYLVSQTQQSASQ